MMTDYARAIPMPSTLKGTVNNCFHEHHFAAGIQLLESLSSARDGSKKVYIPAPEHLSLLATLAVHPDFANDPELYQEVSVPACRYLRRITSAVGPSACGIGDIWRFDKHERKSRRKRKLNQATGPFKNIDMSKYEVEESLWGNAENLWQVVGWAFSTGHTAWLGFIRVLLHVLEIDLRDKEPKDSLVVQYLRTDIHSELGWKKALKAIFAGSAAVSYQVAPIYEVRASADIGGQVGQEELWAMESVLLRQRLLGLFADVANTSTLIKKDELFTNLTSYLFIDLSYDDYIRFISLARWKERDEKYLCMTILCNYGTMDGQKIRGPFTKAPFDVSSLLNATSNSGSEFRNAKIRVVVDRIVQDHYVRQKADPTSRNSSSNQRMISNGAADNDGILGEDTVDAQMRVLTGINRGYQGI